MPVGFDFDIAWDAFEKDGDVLPVEAGLRRMAKKHGVEVTGIDYCGPGGGNPNVTATAPDKEKARAFLRDVYNPSTLDEEEAWVDPVLEHIP